jgi:ribosome-binding protein aMBF1 (putative translation factor)
MSFPGHLTHGEKKMNCDFCNNTIKGKGVKMSVDGLVLARYCSSSCRSKASSSIIFSLENMCREEKQTLNMEGLNDSKEHKK